MVILLGILGAGMVILLWESPYRQLRRMEEARPPTDATTKEFREFLNPLHEIQSEDLLSVLIDEDEEPRHRAWMAFALVLRGDTARKALVEAGYRVKEERVASAIVQALGWDHESEWNLSHLDEANRPGEPVLFRSGLVPSTRCRPLANRREADLTIHHAALDRRVPPRRGSQFMMLLRFSLSHVSGLTGRIWELIGDPRVHNERRDELVMVLRGAPEPETEEEMDALIRMRHPLSSTALGTDRSVFRLTAALVLGCRISPSSIDLCDRLVRDYAEAEGDDMVPVSNLISILGRNRDSDVAARINNLLCRYSRELRGTWVAESAVMALSDRPSEQAKDCLLEILHDPELYERGSLAHYVNRGLAGWEGLNPIDRDLLWDRTLHLVETRTGLGRIDALGAIAPLIESMPDIPSRVREGLEKLAREAESEEVRSGIRRLLSIPGSARVTLPESR